MQNSRLITNRLFLSLIVSLLSYVNRKKSFEVEQHLGLTVGFRWGIVIDSAVVALGDLGGRDTTLHQFVGDEVGTRCAEGLVDGCRSCGTVGGTDDGDMQTILDSKLSQCVEVERLRRFGKRGGVQVEEEVHWRTDTDLSKLDTSEVFVEQGFVLRCVATCERIGKGIGIHRRIAIPIFVSQSCTEGV